MVHRLLSRIKYLMCFFLCMSVLPLGGCAIATGIGIYSVGMSAYSVIDGIWKLQEWLHYQDKASFVTETGQVIAIFNHKDRIEFWLSELEPSDGYHDPSFVVRGKNAEILKEKGLYSKVSSGDIIEYVYHPSYLGNGYIRPIVALKTMDGEEILGFEEGYKNLLDSYR